MIDVQYTDKIKLPCKESWGDELNIAKLVWLQIFFNINTKNDWSDKIVIFLLFKIKVYLVDTQNINFICPALWS